MRLVLGVLAVCGVVACTQAKSNSGGSGDPANAATTQASGDAQKAARSGTQGTDAGGGQPSTTPPLGAVPTLAGDAVACPQPVAATPGLWIAGGQVVAAGSVAAQTALGFFDADKVHGGCNGTRVGFNFLVAAAHCISAPESFLIGYVDPGSPSCQKPAFAPASITAFVVHPQFDAVHGDASDDIGLIIVQPLAPGTDPLPGIPIQPVAGFFDATGAPLVVPSSTLLEAGWGLTPTATNTTPTILNSVVNTVASLDSTRAELTYVANTGKGACNLDSGAPALKLNADGSVLGLVSIANRGALDAQGQELARAVGSGIDVDVRYYRKWMSCAAAKAAAAFGLSSGISTAAEDDDKSDAACAATAIVGMDVATANARNCPAGTTLSSADWVTCVAN